MTHRTSILALAIALTLGVLASPSTAQACGGFFCNNTSLIAVEQTKERILFEVNGDGTVTAHVEIAFQGSPDDFSWAVPVPATPDLDVVPPSTLMLMDAATAPRVIPPDQYGWDDADEDPAPGGGADDDDDDDFDGNDGVEVEDLPQVGPYDPQMVSSDDPDALADWLSDNGYLVTDEMRPFIAEYVAGGMGFLCMKLAPGSDVQDIAPIKMTYPSDLPMIPLILTAVAAEPEMGVLVFIAGDQRYQPTNYASLFVDDDLLRADPRNGDTNYYPLLSFLAEQEDRLAFFTEWSDGALALSSMADSVWLGTDDEQEAKEYVAALATRHSTVTRLYTRLNNVDMVLDPMFGAAGSSTVSNVHDLSGHAPVHIDYSVDPQLPCNDTFCGLGGVCASTVGGDGDGCACDAGYVARRIEGPSVSSVGSTPTVTCQDATFNLMASLDMEMDVDPCAGWTCGEGVCEPLNGMPTCRCDDGYAAVPVGERLRCREVDTLYDAEQLLWPNWPTDPDAAEPDAGASAVMPGSLAGCDGCSSSGAAPSSGLLLLLAISLGARLRRR